MLNQLVCERFRYFDPGGFFFVHLRNESFVPVGTTLTSLLTPDKRLGTSQRPQQRCNVALAGIVPSDQKDQRCHAELSTADLTDIFRFELPH
jgi:hypothetical protein